MKHKIYSIVIVAILTLGIYTVPRVNAQSATSDNDPAYIQQLLQIIQGLQEQLTTLTQQKKQNTKLSVESFTKEPGAIKAVKQNNNGEWIFTVDLLSYNPNWKPGGQSDYYLNQNLKLRNFKVNQVTKSFVCGETAIPNVPRDINATVTYITNYMNKIKAESIQYNTKPYDVIFIFNVKTGIVSSIAEPCVP